MRRLAIGTLALLLWGCVVPDEVIATVPDPSTTAGSGGGGGGEAFPFVPGPSVTLDCAAPSDIASGTLDGDSALDLAVVGGCLNLLTGASDLHTLDPDPFSVVAIDDVAGTGAPDLVAAGQHLAIFESDGSTLHLLEDLPLSQPAVSLTLGDLAGDLGREIVLGLGHELWLYHQGADLHFAGAAIASFPGAVHGHALADFDGDGDLDIAVASGGVALLENDGSDFVTVAGPALVDGDAVRTLLAGRIDGDDCVDLVALDGWALEPGSAAGHAHVLINPCRGAVELVAHDLIGLAALVDAALADLDGDGQIDLTALQADPIGALVFAPGIGDGTFGAPLTLPLSGDPRALALGDFDGDARLDAAIARHDGDVTLLLGTPR